MSTGIYHVSEKRREKEHRGEGSGADYKPWIYVREIKSEGTSSEPIDWTNGRTCQLLSQGEKYFWYYLRWDDKVKNIYEQYPLDLASTNEIAVKTGIEPMQKGTKRMTTDLYVEYIDGHYEAYSVKDSRSMLEDERKVELQFIEMQYWENKGIPWHIVYKEDLNVLYVQNLEVVTTFYQLSDVHDIYSYIKFLIAHKLLEVDLKTSLIDFNAVYEGNRELIDEYYNNDIGTGIVNS